MAPSPALAFGPFVLDTVRGALTRGGTDVPLTPKAFLVLEYLARRPGQLVTKKELFDAAWPGTFIADGALKVCVNEIRKALDDDAKQPRYVETAHRRGYRFVAPLAAHTTHARPIAPPVRYARSGDVNIAYQVAGDGPIDLVFVMGWVSHLESFWSEPGFARFLTRLASFTRLILLDKRGTGLSDRVAELPSLEQRMDDVRAVMDAVGSRRAVLMGVSEGGPLCALFAATYPEKTAALIMIGSYARRLRDEDYPWGPTQAEHEQFCDTILREWGGPVGLEQRAPGMVNDAAFRDWWASYLRMGASPGAAVALTRMNAAVDIRPILGTIRVPTLVIHRTGDRCLLVDEGRYLASQIRDARFVELPGDDHLPFAGDLDAVVDAVEGFLRDARAGSSGTHVLATVLCAEVDADPGLAKEMRDEVERFRGRVCASSGGSLIATFDGPARAIRAASSVARVAARDGRNFSAGVHTGECVISSSAISGPACESARAFARLAPPGQVLVSRAAKDLVAGTGLSFEPSGLSAGTAAAPQPLFFLRG